MKFVDIHTHRAKDSDTIQIIDFSEEQEVNIRISNYYSLGIHPWFVTESELDRELQKIENHISADFFLAVGECGLDKVCNTDFNLQLRAFEKQIALSEKYKKPLILHTVKAFNELIQIRLKSKIKQVWIVHGFNGNKQLAKQLTDLGMYISFGSQLGKSVSKASNSIGSVPIHRLFLETDTSEFRIEEIYALAAERLSIDVAQLQQQLWLNFQDVFQ